MYKKLFVLAVAVVFTMAMVPSASAGAGGNSQRLSDFETLALDADGCLKLVECSAHMVTLPDGTVRENYRCELVEDPDFWGTPALPANAVIWDEVNSAELTGEGCTIVIPGPYRFFSDVEEGLTNDGCFMYTNAKGTDIGDTGSGFRQVVTPSGNVNITIVYDPPVFELGNGDPCP